MLRRSIRVIPEQLMIEMDKLRLLCPTTLSFLKLLPLLLLTGTAIRIYLSFRRLQHVKGPWYAAISPLWLAYHAIRGDIYLATEDVIKRYGSPARIGPNMIVTDDPELYRLMTAPRSPFSRGHWFKGLKFDPGVDNVLSMTDEKAHADLRAKLMPGYTGKEVFSMEADIDAQVLALIDLIRRDYVDKNEQFDFARLAGYFTLDSLTSIAFGRAAGFLKANEDLFDYHKATAKFFPILELGSNHPTVLRILHSRLIQAFAGPRHSGKIGLGAILRNAHRVVAERFGSEAKTSGDMLSSFIRHGLTQVQCESEAVIQIVAGSDSTATALRTTVIHILSNPPVYMKLICEINAAINNGNVSFPVIKNAEAQMLPYLQACIKEGLRMFMPLNGLAGRTSPSPNGFTYNHVLIPPGTEVGAAIYAMLRRKDVFGNDADTFCPDRWIDNDPQTVKEYERVQELCFGYGRDSCLGKPIALMELGKILFELFRNYDFCIVNPLAGIETWSNGPVVQKNMFLRAWPRKSA